MRKHILTQMILLTFGGVVLTGCGGGGSDSASTVPAANLAITEGNAQETAKTAFDSGMNLLNSDLLGIASSGQTGSSSITLKDIALDAVNRMRAHAGSGTSGLVTAQATSSETEECPKGGTITYTVVDQDDDPMTFHAGDSIKFAFNGCKTWDSVEYNGTQTISVISLTENSETRLKASFKVSNDLNITSGSEKASVKGAIQVSLDETRECQYCYPTTAMMELKSDNIEFTSGNERVAIYALDYAIYNDITSGAWWFTQDNVLDFNGQVVRIDTTARFDGKNCSYPYQGSAMIYGKNSSVKVTARSGNVTDLEIDKDGNGTIDATKQVGSGEVFSVYCGY